MAKTNYLRALAAATGMLLAVGMLLIIVVLVKPAEAAFPGKNGKIAYVGEDGNDSEIYTINPEGGGKVQVTNNTTDDSEPSFSPSGKSIAYEALFQASGGGEVTDIYTINADGGGKSKVTEGFEPSYSPDGTKIAYASGGDIYTINADGGGGKVQVTNSTTSEISPSYSPDGTKIAFATFASSDGQDEEIYTINADGGGGGRVQVTDNLINDTDPDYSPDGNRIALTGCEAGFVEVGTGKDCEIYTINAEGGGRVQVTDNTTEDFHPSYSPDGNKIAYQSKESPTAGEWEIYTINADGGGGGRVQVTENTTSDGLPSWGGS